MVLRPVLDQATLIVSLYTLSSGKRERSPPDTEERGVECALPRSEKGILEVGGIFAAIDYCNGCRRIIVFPQTCIVVFTVEDSAPTE